MFLKEWFNSVLLVSVIGTLALLLGDVKADSGLKRALRLAVSLALSCSVIIPVARNLKSEDFALFDFSFEGTDYTVNYLSSLEKSLSDAIREKIYENTGIKVKDISIELDIKDTESSKEVVVKSCVITLSEKDKEQKEQIEKMIDLDAEIKISE